MLTHLLAVLGFSLALGLQDRGLFQTFSPQDRGLLLAVCNIDRRIALAGTRLARATCGSIRLKLLKIGALVTRSVRRIRIAMASACPYAEEFRIAHARLCP